MIATFAVVGHPNKGKSSIVATLAEDERVAISATPGTTRTADRFVFAIDGQPYYELFDTPGFQRAKAVLDWCRARETNSSERPALIREFVQAHRNDERFHDECTLLKPILDGAGILYVVDGTKPYGPEFDIEMEILRWTGQPRMALINLIGDGDYVDQWRHALDQYFSIVRVFDAMHADFETRLNVLRAFCELDEGWRSDLEQAISAMQTERGHRLQTSARQIADCLIDCMTASRRTRLADADALAQTKLELTERLQADLRKREREARDEVQAIYRHQSLDRNEQPLAVLEQDLFTREGWELFGLSKTQLVITGSVSGALAGLGLDAVVGGASLLLGTSLGALIGGASTWFGSSELAKTTILGDPIGGDLVEVGPVSQPNFPWVLLGRAWIHHHLVRERNHALREALSLEIEDNLMDRLPDDERRELTRTFTRIRGGEIDTSLREKLVASVQNVLSRDPFRSA